MPSAGWTATPTAGRRSISRALRATLRSCRSARSERPCRLRGELATDEVKLQASHACFSAWRFRNGDARSSQCCTGDGQRIATWIDAVLEGGSAGTALLASVRGEAYGTQVAKAVRGKA